MTSSGPLRDLIVSQMKNVWFEYFVSALKGAFWIIQKVLIMAVIYCHSMDI